MKTKFFVEFPQELYKGRNFCDFLKSYVCNCNVCTTLVIMVTNALVITIFKYVNPKIPLNLCTRLEMWRTTREDGT